MLTDLRENCEELSGGGCGGLCLPMVVVDQTSTHKVPYNIIKILLVTNKYPKIKID